MKYSAVGLALSIVFLVSTSAHAQFVRETLPGPPSATFIGFAADGSGWIVTTHGSLMRISASRTVSAASGSMGNVEDAVFLPDGTIWTAGTGGLVKRDPAGVITTYPIGSLTNIERAANGDFWVTSSEHASLQPRSVHRVSPAGIILATHTLDRGVSDSREGGAVYASGGLWFWQPTGLVRIGDDGSRATFPAPVAKPRLVLAPNVGLWLFEVGGSWRTFRFDFATHQSTEFMSFVGAQIVGSWTVGSDGALWIANRDDLLRLDGLALTRFDLPLSGRSPCFSLPAFGYGMALDPLNRIWVIDRYATDIALPGVPCFEPWPPESVLHASIEELTVIEESHVSGHDVPSLSGMALGVLSLLLAAAAVFVIRK